VRALWLVALAACGLPDGDYFGRIDRAQPGHLRWCNQAEPDHLDPVMASSTASAPIVAALFDGVMTYGPTGAAVPSLATSFEVGADLRTYTFHLRSDARWSNGRAIDGYDVAYTALRVLAPVVASPNADNLSPLQNAAALLQRRVYVLAHDAPPYRAGDVVELAGDDPSGDPNHRVARDELALRDLGASSDAAYARVPAGDDVVVLAWSGGKSTPRAPDGRSWAYVLHGGADGPWGWVPDDDLAPTAEAAMTFHVRGVADADGGPGPRDVVVVTGRDLRVSPDALGLAVPDPHTLVLTTTAPTPWLPSLAAGRALRPTPTEAVSRAPTAWTSPDRIVTSGPLALADWRPRDRLEMVRAPSYWNAADVHVDRVTVLPIDDQAAAADLYFTGACDATATNTIPASYLPALAGELRGRPYKDYRASPYLGVYYLWVNTQKLANRHLRRALALAVDRREVPRFTHGGELPTAALTPGTPLAALAADDRARCSVTAGASGFALLDGDACYTTPPGLDYDPSAARAELAAARTDLGSGFPATLHYRYNAGSEAHAQIAEYLQAEWAAIGLDVELEAEDWNALLADTRDGNFEIARFAAAGTVPDTESDFLPLLRCGAPDNRGRYCSRDFEARMDAARPLRDRAARNAVLRDAEAIALADAPVIPLYVYTQKHLVKPFVHGYATNLVDQVALWRVSVGDE
jgi:oligopeptide transport system substrate-binding protein